MKTKTAPATEIPHVDEVREAAESIATTAIERGATRTGVAESIRRCFSGDYPETIAFAQAVGDELYMAHFTAGLSAREIIENIASVALGFDHLKAKGSDREDFREVACWQVEAALKLAYEAGQAAGR